MPYDQHETGYEDTISNEVRASNRPVILPLILAVLKRPWLAIGSIFFVMIPIVFYLFSQVPVYRSSSIVSLKSDNQNNLLNFTRFSENSREFSANEEFYLYLLDSYSYRSGIVKRIIIGYPHFPVDSINSLVRSGVSYTKKARSKNFLYIYGQSESPEFAQFLAQQAITSFQELSLKLRRSDTKLVADFVDKQLEEVNAKLSQKEAHLQGFLRERRLSFNDVASGVDSELNELERRLSSAKAESDLAKLQISTFNKQIEERLNSYLSGNDNSKDSVINNLRSQLENLNEELNKFIRDTLTTNIDSLDFHNLQFERKKVLSELIRIMHQQRSNDSKDVTWNRQISIDKLETELENSLVIFKQAEIELSYYRTAVDKYLNEHPNLPQDLLEYVNISRTKSVLQKAIDILIEKRETIRIEMASESGGIKVIDEPRIPSHPIPQRRGQKLALAFIVALIIGFGLAYSIDIFDNTIQGEMDIASRFNLPVYGSIPVLSLRGYLHKNSRQTSTSNKENGKVNITLLNLHSESSPVAEAYRSIRTSILFTAQERQQKAFVISSAVAGEGKSVTTYNLGVSFAQGGNKTLIVDTDLRRSSIHKLFNIKRYPGITDYLLGDNPIDEVIFSSSVENLYTIPSGVKVSNPADLISSNRMRAFLDEVSPLFDIILFDSSPITPCMDSRNLANLVDGMIYVVRAESTKTNIFEHSLSLLQRVNVDILGVIINYASFRYGYGYYYMYHRYHSYGYYSGGYHYYYYFYYQDSETGEKTKKRSRSKTESKEIDTVT
ncbi:MAG: polysaccharide biosynthesis tyrosine autokinase [Candidatus Hatepunaea meridiana]|nr:polysaccharide biosynthesis tyrosine autokinase [Candidatus Hatepunaea meridiana]